VSSRRAAQTVAGRRAVAEAVAAGEATEVLVAHGARPSQGLQRVIEAARAADVPVRRVSRAELDAFSRDHRGAVALLRGAADDEPRLRERDLETYSFADDSFVVVLDGIEDPQNLGAAVTPAAVRASAGALLHLPHARVANIARAVDRLRTAGFLAVGLDEDAEQTVFDTPCPPGRVAVVVGSEGTGLTRLVRERCDALIALPMLGRVGSLNASAALAAVLYAYVVPTRAWGRMGTTPTT
jgi:23S rRNA (guanosine2251-2'-O)-methyltransferase